MAPDGGMGKLEAREGAEKVRDGAQLAQSPEEIKDAIAKEKQFAGIAKAKGQILEEMRTYFASAMNENRQQIKFNLPGDARGNVVRVDARYLKEGSLEKNVMDMLVQVGLSDEEATQVFADFMPYAADKLGLKYHIRRSPRYGFEMYIGHDITTEHSTKFPKELSAEMVTDPNTAKLETFCKEVAEMAKNGAVAIETDYFARIGYTDRTIQIPKGANADFVQELIRKESAKPDNISRQF